ncbi:2-dehydro-3-deoxy-D-gluconate 5-dehydrogenase KduD [Gracilinema caldarium]|uniref:2-dehydro-3-deoxy-D-gluconate 5-dehydrogenase n=1 Tax=Gracilinema caldarium (strain ATCC 51460 / DSM 7334 / H1) TaxID=744872 RepID=F8F1D8_GRAC1|nr:2-dehydro-3-deoxy-D-gluconate 5-dehydrogenase KduD [Gracilinema caldarium]AEJ18782.1 2-deoxy-D-gluconate 3-dehydrogenase [Gracilinema caldarium DSM 7334]
MVDSIQQFRLDEKVALVTGCNRGLGQAMAIALAQAGADIIGVSASPDARETEGMVTNTGRRFIYISADLRSTQPIPYIMDKAIQGLGKIDILVNNAGIIKRNDALAFLESEWDEVINLNLKTVFFLSQAAARFWVEHKSKGKIINVASMLSFQGGIRVPSYTASKSGIRGLTMALSNEWAKYGINVNAIAPGYMATDNTEALRKDPQRSQEILARIPAGRWGDASDLAGAVVFLASQASDYVHGHTLAVDGGWLGR